MEPLTKTQQKVYNYIRMEIKANGVPPSIREICDGVGLSSTSSVHLQLNTLERKGYISRSKSKNRSIVILEDNFYKDEGSLKENDYVDIPIVGTVTAGSPILATENLDGYFPLPSSYLPNGQCFMLRIRGNSMINAGIYNNDLVLVKQQPEANDGEIIIALIDDSATCKRYYKEAEYVRLQPENESYEPIFVRDIKIIGKVVGLFRSYK